MAIPIAASRPPGKHRRMTLDPHSRCLEPGPRNLVTDVEGFQVGNASDAALKSGTTVLTAEQPFTAAVHVMGGAPGTRETDLLAPDRLVRKVDALVLSGGSAFGLDAASGVADAMAESGRGFPVGAVRVPIVPAAILFDLLNGGDKNWKENPYGGLGRRALKNAGTDFELGTAGAGTGATTANLKGGPRFGFSGARERNHGRGTGRGKPGRLGHHSRKLQVLGSPV